MLPVVEAGLAEATVPDDVCLAQFLKGVVLRYIAFPVSRCVSNFRVFGVALLGFVFGGCALTGLVQDPDARPDEEDEDKVEEEQLPPLQTDEAADASRAAFERVLEGSVSRMQADNPSAGEPIVKAHMCLAFVLQELDVEPDKQKE